MNNINYSKETEKTALMSKSSNEPLKLLLHCCCAPCSSSVLEYLSNYFLITCYFYNPNIESDKEYQYRKSELERFISEFDSPLPINIINGDYEPDVYYETVKGLENEPERGKRCLKCFELRLLNTALTAKENGFDYFATTLTLSPLKSARDINNIGINIQDRVGIKYMCSDFKKNNGYKRSIELSKKHGLYRQNYCGCVFSKKN